MGKKTKFGWTLVLPCLQHIFIYSYTTTDVRRYHCSVQIWKLLQNQSLKNYQEWELDKLSRLEEQNWGNEGKNSLKMDNDSKGTFTVESGYRTFESLLGLRIDH